MNNRPAPQKEDTVNVPWKTMPLWTLLAVERLGGEAANGDIVEQIGQLADIDLEQAGKSLEVRLGRVRTDLKKRGLLDNTGRGVWRLTAVAVELLKDPMGVLADALGELEQSIGNVVPDDTPFWTLLGLHRLGGSATGDDLDRMVATFTDFDGLTRDQTAIALAGVRDDLRGRNMITVDGDRWSLTPQGVDVLETADPTSSLTRPAEPPKPESEPTAGETPEPDPPEDSEPVTALNGPQPADDDPKQVLPWLAHQISAAERTVSDGPDPQVEERFSNAMRVFDRVWLSRDSDYLPTEQETRLHYQFSQLMGTFGRVNTPPLMRLVLAQLWQDRNMPTDEEMEAAAQVFIEHAPTLTRRWSLTREAFERFGVPGELLDRAGIHNSFPLALVGGPPDNNDEDEENGLFDDEPEVMELTPPEDEDDDDTADVTFDDPFPDPHPEPEPGDDEVGDLQAPVPGFLLEDDEEAPGGVNPTGGETGDLADLFPQDEETERLGFYNTKDLNVDTEVEVAALTKKPGVWARLTRWWRSLDKKNNK